MSIYEKEAGGARGGACFPRTETASGAFSGTLIIG